MLKRRKHNSDIWLAVFLLLISALDMALYSIDPSSAPLAFANFYMGCLMLYSYMYPYRNWMYSISTGLGTGLMAWTLVPVTGWLSAVGFVVFSALTVASLFIAYVQYKWPDGWDKTDVREE